MFGIKKIDIPIVENERVSIVAGWPISFPKLLETFQHLLKNQDVLDKNLLNPTSEKKTVVPLSFSGTRIHTLWLITHSNCSPDKIIFLPWPSQSSDLNCVKKKNIMKKGIRYLKDLESP